MSKIIITYGRFNPPTQGHKILIDSIQQLSIDLNIPYQIWVSHSHDKKKNPLSLDRKLFYLKSLFGELNFKHSSKEMPGIISILTHLNQSYDEIIIIVGQDRQQIFKHLLDEYNQKNYHYKSIEVISCGNRNQRSNSFVETISASRARDAVTNNDFTAFVSCMPTNVDIAILTKLFEELTIK